MSIEICVVGADDAQYFECVAGGVFDNPVDPVSLARFLADPGHHLVVARDEDQVVGMISAVAYIHPDKPLQLWINELGVADNYLRRGIGRRLVAAMLDLGVALGCRDTWVATERDNEPAKRLYAAMGSKADDVVMYAFDRASLGNRCYSVWRLDDNGNEFRVDSFTTLAEAEAMREAYAAKGHKQTYSIRVDPD